MLSALDHVEIGPPPLPATPEPPPPAAAPARKLDLNTAGFPQLLLLPEMTPGAAKAIVDYRKQNGPFHSLDDLGSVPGLDKRLLLQLIDQVTVSPLTASAPAPTPAPVATVARLEPPAATPTGYPEMLSGEKIDLNTADRDELARVPGLGPVAAARIVEFRARNGPFPDVDGLKAVRGIPAAKLSQARPFLIASAIPTPAVPARTSTPAPRPAPPATKLALAATPMPVSAEGRVNINAAGVEELLTLPRMTRDAAMQIVAFRQKNGPFAEPHSITHVPSIGEAAYARLRDRISVGR